MGRKAHKVTEISEEIGDLIKDLRTQRRIRQAEIADACDVQQYQVSTWERAERVVTIENFFDISRAFQTSPGALLDELQARLRARG